MKQGRGILPVDDEAVAKVTETATSAHRPITMEYEEFERFSATLNEAPTAISELVDLLCRKSRIPS